MKYLFKWLKSIFPKNNIYKKIKFEVEKDFPLLTHNARDAIIKSRLGIITNSTTFNLIKADFGDNGSKKIKEDLFK